MTFRCLPRLKVYSSYLASAKEIPFCLSIPCRNIISLYLHQITLTGIDLPKIYKIAFGENCQCWHFTFLIKGRDSILTCQKCMPRRLRDFWSSSVCCIDQKCFPFQVFHLNHCFHLCLEHPVHKNKNVYAQDPDHFVTINCSLEDKGCDCIIMGIVSTFAVNNCVWSMVKGWQKGRKLQFIYFLPSWQGSSVCRERL